MNSKKSAFQLILGTTLAVFGMANALAAYEPNDNYSSLVLSYQSSRFSEPICIGGVCHEGVSGPSLVFAHQVIPNLALGLAGSYLQSSASASSINSSYGSVFAQGIVGLGSQVDVGASVAILRTTLELCVTNPSACASTNDSGTDLGVFGKVFLDRMRSVSVGMSFNRVIYDKSASQSIVALSVVTVLARRHRLAFSVDKSIDASGNAVSGGYGFGYSYLVF